VAIPENPTSSAPGDVLRQLHSEKLHRGRRTSHGSANLMGEEESKYLGPVGKDWNLLKVSGTQDGWC